MSLALGLLACLALWWLSRNRGRLRPLIGTWPTHRLAGWAALAAAAFLLLRGNVVLAALLGLGGVWMLEGAEGVARRARRTFSFAARPAPGRSYRTALIAVELRPDGSFGEGRVIGGPAAGARLDDLAPAATAELLRLCRVNDPEGAALLEAYLDRRSPGWRVDAEGDRDPRPGRPAKPGTMTEQEAHEILGLQRGASAEQIRAAHRALMKSAHPDQGGSAERAARVNAARDRLLNRHR
ncbi:DnaJ domain-containing protein [Methylobacterium sp. NEAU 140]|uniref:J domain-containing protein n=1 Tax=Methylobacterium sp. NEAU 140 TaxID=3064945 RepID=UPI0027338450|nr:DnaJ domain-containing protein [Methylobacterium sp. NEAU 140]MDP4024587.1 DnaJ domain-containing protein [Methylobacterium sp. NEAU 140]